MPRIVRRARRLPGLALGLLLGASFSPTDGMATERSDARRFLAHALALRVAGHEGEGSAVLSRIPGGLARGSAGKLWQPFFGNAMVALGRLNSSSPAALYYNPLLDIAISTIWERWEGGWRVAAVRALPGERLNDPRGTVPLHPSWVTAGENPLDTLVAVVDARLAAFHRMHPPGSSVPARVATTFAADAADARAARPRLLWHARQRIRWASDAETWLGPTLAAIARTLSARDARAVRSAAPATDFATAEAIAGLPRGLASRLVLDMVLGAGGHRRLLIGSLPEDGEMYFVVLCRQDGAACALRRIILLSVLDGSGKPGKTRLPDRR